MATPDDQKFRLPNLNQVPCDIWSTREKLALATSVEKSGDQNWNSVSRSLKSFPEENRPSDWFHYKLCALQYRDMLDKTECPKRKRERKERSEETTQSIIVKKLTSERITELTKGIPETIRKFCELKASLDKMQNSTCDDQLFHKVSSYVREKIKRENLEEVERQKWINERQPKVLHLLRRPKQPIKSPAVAIPTGEIFSDSDSKTNALEEATNKKDSKETVATAEKDPSLLSVVQGLSQLSPKSPRIISEQNEAKSNEKEVIILLDESQDEGRGDESAAVSNAGLKADSTDTSEINGTPLAHSEDIAQRDSAKGEIIAEQENSNDTIEETFESAHIHKDDSNAAGENKNDLAKLIAKDAPDAVASKAEVSTNKDVPDIKIEEDSLLSVDHANSTLDATTESLLDTPKETRRRKRRRASKLPNATAMQTRSTRSQSHIKSEEQSKEVATKETAKGPGKRRSNSADESTSVDNTISEESNDAKSSTTESAQNEEVVDRKLRKSLNYKLNNIISHRHARYFLQTVADHNYGHIVYQPINLNTIKQRIHTGRIKSDLELKRDLLLMFSNALNWNGRQARVHKATLELIADTFKMFDTSDQKITRTRERNSHTPEIKTKIGRRKTRGSISDKSMNKKKN